MESAFNVDSILNQTVNQEMSTELLQLPDGEYSGVTQPVTEKSFVSYVVGQGDNAGKQGLILNLQWAVNDESGDLKTYLGRAPSVRQSIFLDINSDGSLDFGKGRNVQLGQLRAAFNQNMNGQPWSFGMLGGQVGKIKVKTELRSGRSNTNVVAVTKL